MPFYCPLTCISCYHLMCTSSLYQHQAVCHPLVLLSLKVPSGYNRRATLGERSPEDSSKSMPSMQGACKIGVSAYAISHGTFDHWCQWWMHISSWVWHHPCIHMQKKLLDWWHFFLWGTFDCARSSLVIFLHHPFISCDFSNKDLHMS